MANTDRQEYYEVLINSGFKRIADAIELMWGSPELDVYFIDLVISKREDRKGFPDEVLTAIIKLSNINSGIADLHIVKRDR